MTPKMSVGDPAALMAAGTAMRDLANVLSRLCEDGQVAAGGRVETEVAKVEAGGGDGGFNQAFRPVAQGLVAALISAAHQTQDGALALWMGGRAFTAADTVNSYEHHVPPGADPSTRHVDPDSGAITYTDSAGDEHFTVDSYGNYYGVGGYKLPGDTASNSSLTINAPLPEKGALPSPSISDTNGVTVRDAYPDLTKLLLGEGGTPPPPASGDPVQQLINDMTGDGTG